MTRVDDLLGPAHRPLVHWQELRESLWTCIPRRRRSTGSSRCENASRLRTFMSMSMWASISMVRPPRAQTSPVYACSMPREGNDRRGNRRCRNRPEGLYCVLVSAQRTRHLLDGQLGQVQSRDHSQLKRRVCKYASQPVHYSRCIFQLTLRPIKVGGFGAEGSAAAGGGPKGEAVISKKTLLPQFLQKLWLTTFLPKL